MSSNRVVLAPRRVAVSVILLLLISAACGPASPPQQPLEQPPVPTEAYGGGAPATESSSAAGSSPATFSTPTDTPPALSVPTATTGAYGGLGGGQEGSPSKTNPTTQDFSSSGANGTTPDDILQEIAFGGMGGGGPIVYCRHGKFKTPAVDPDNTATVVDWLAGFIYVTTCGWRDGERVQIVVQSPAGKIRSKTVRAELDPQTGIGAAEYDYFLSADDPTGVYAVTFSGNSGTVEQDVDVSSTRGPRMVYVKDSGEYYLYGFAPGESIRFFWYNTPTSTGDVGLTAWQEYTADSNGQLIIHVPTRDGVYAAIGALSGIPLNGPQILAGQGPARVCADALPSRLTVGGYAYVSDDPPLDSRVRDMPGTGGTITGFISARHSMHILDGPRCADGLIWWNVQSLRNASVAGWTAEADSASYLLIPCASSSSCP